MSKRLALLIGHSSYQDDRLTIPHTGSGDVTALAEILRDRQHGRFDNVHVLLDKTAVDVQLGIAAFLEQPLAPDDLILLYFAGHCLLDKRAVYLAAADTFTETYLDATTIDADFIRRRLAYCPAQKVVVLDCGVSRFDGAAAPDAPAVLAQAFGGPGVAIFLAVASAPLPQPSSFTQALTNGLRGLAADRNQDGRLTLQEWFAAAQTDHAPWQKLADETQDGWVITAVSPDKLIPPPIPAVTPSKQRSYLLPVLLLILLLGLGGVYALGGFAPALSPTPTSEAAGIARVTETAVPATEEPTLTAVPATPTIPAKPTQTDTPPQTPTPSPAPSFTPTSLPSTTVSPTRTPSATATATAVPTVTPTVAPIPMQITAEAAFLRAGPGVNYKIIAFPLQGTPVTAVARNSDATWYNIVLADGTSGWIYTDVIRPADVAAGPALPVAATIPAPVNEFYDFFAQDTGSALIAQVYHAYVGTHGEEAFLRARLLPETDQVQPAYLNGNDLGLGLRIVQFTRTGSAPYTSESVEFCMVDTAGEAFFCQTFPARKVW
ncbi:MAG: SH3 domain-containing protein [Chloroflexi bacterium]|nr:SH3 domain-containing protein [Chloroflexota bacterium]